MTNKITKEKLIENLAIANSEIRRLMDEDHNIRKSLSELLKSFDFSRDKWSGNTEKTLCIQNWIGIAFMIGELRSDADYSLTLEKCQRIENDLTRALNENERLNRLLKKNKPNDDAQNS